jgi:hypothetical protein
MNSTRPPTARKRNETGYALLLVIFLVTLVLIAAVAASPDILTQGKREREKEMIWRGKQYARGVKLYYRKLGRFPTSLDDLTKPKVGSLRFMRQAYKDPMNKEEGSWRLIYVGPAGQLIGSLKPPQKNLQFPQAAGVGTPAGTLGSIGSFSQPGTAGTQGASQPQAGSQLGATTPGAATSGATPPGTNPPGTTGTPVSADQSDSGSNPDQVPAGDTPTIIGGNIIGVGSKVNKRSIIVYEKAKNYRLFEFIWDPSKDNLGVGQPGMQTGTGLGQPPGQPPFGQQPGQMPFGQQPGQNPINPPQNPQPNPPQPQNPQQQP